MNAETLTNRLVLAPIDEADAVMVAAIFALQSDARTWMHLPEGVETDISQSRSIAEDHSRSWRDEGLGWWAIRLRDELPGVADDQIIGIGGAGIRRPEFRAWNLGYRLSPLVWGHGFAAELSHAAITAANAAHPDLPVTARALTRNPASWRTLERTSLSLRWEGDAPADYPPTSGALRRVYSDRDVSAGLLDQLIALG